MVEALVSSAAWEIKVRQPVNVRVPASDFRFGSIEAKIDNLSASTFPNDEGELLLQSKGEA